MRPISAGRSGDLRPAGPAFGRSAVRSGSLRLGMVSNAVRSIWAEPRAPTRRRCGGLGAGRRAGGDGDPRGHLPRGRDLATGRARARCGAGVPAAGGARTRWPRSRSRSACTSRSRSRPFSAPTDRWGWTPMCILLFTYALFRWGSGREADRAGDHPGRLRPRDRRDYTGLVDAALASVFAVPRGARRRGPLPDHLLARAAGSGQAPRAGAAGARAARHRRPPRLGHRDPAQAGRLSPAPIPVPPWTRSRSSRRRLHARSPRCAASSASCARTRSPARPAARRGRHHAARRPSR